MAIEFPLQLLQQYGLQISIVEQGNEIPGSYWGESEAGLIGNTLYLRADTPLHSALHEACHYICMDEERRQQLNTDAGGCYQEENAVCYLQILLANLVPGSSQSAMQKAMDDWGYSFRLGSAQAWFEEDAEDAKDFLVKHRLMSANNIVCIGGKRY
jgi:hypothetical protein